MKQTSLLLQGKDEVARIAERGGEVLLALKAAAWTFFAGDSMIKPRSFCYRARTRWRALRRGAARCCPR